MTPSDHCKFSTD